MISFLSFLISLVSFTNFSRCAGFYLINATRFPFWSSSDLRRNHFVITKDFIPAIAGFSILLNLYWCNFLHELSVLGKINETLIFSVAILFCWAIFYQDPAAHQKCSPPMLVWDTPVPNCRFGGTRLHTRRPLTGRWEPPDPMGSQPKCSISWESQESHTFFWRDVFGQESSMFVVHQKDLLSKVKQIHFYFMFRNRW